MGVVGREARAIVEAERLSHAPRRAIGVVGVTVAGGVMGFEVKGPVEERVLGKSFRLDGRTAGAPPVDGRGPSTLRAKGAEKADPISESVSERTCMRMDGAI